MLTAADDPTDAAHPTLLTAERTPAAGGLILVAKFALGALLNYAFGVALAWLLLPQDFAVVSAIQAVLLLSGVVLSAGPPWALARRIAAAEGTPPDEDIRTALLGNAVVSGALVALLFGARAAGLVPVLGDSLALTGVVAATIPVMGFAAVLGGVLQGRRRFVGLAAQTLADILVRCSVGLGLVLGTGAGPLAIAVAALVGSVVACVVGVRSTGGGLPRLGPVAPLHHFRDAGSYWLGTVCFGGLLSLDLLGLAALGDGRGVEGVAVATYQVCAVLARAGYYAGEALSNTVFPYMARSPDRQDSHRWFTAALRWVPLLLAPAQLVVLLAAGTLLRLFYPEQYGEAADVLRLLALGGLGLVLADLHLKALYARRRAGVAALAMGAALGVQLVGLALLVPTLGAVGAALAHVAGSWTAAVLLVAAYVRREAVHRPGPRLRPYALALLLLAAPAALADSLPGPVALLLLGAAGTVYAVNLWCLSLLGEEDRARLRRLARGPRPQPPGDPSAGPTPGAGTGAPAVRTPGSRGPGGLVAVAAVAGLVAAAALFTGLGRSPDTVYDEVVYAQAARNIATAWQLTWTGQPMFVHPPLSFLAQAGWQEVTGSLASLVDGLRAARVLSASAGLVNVLLLVGLAWKLTTPTRPTARIAVVLATGVLAALDPVLLRYSRLAVIEPFALTACLATLYLAWSRRDRRGLAWTGPVGVMGGVALLTKELSAVLVLTPLVFALLRRDRALGLRAMGALSLSTAVWLLFPLWSFQLGSGPSFLDVKTAMFRRLVGTLQISGLNQPGVSLVDALVESASQYASSYAVLALGALALVWLALSVPSERGAFVQAWLMTGYAFAAYITLLGTLNEQFFVYVVPGAIVGTVVLVDAAQLRLRRRRSAGRPRSRVVLAAVVCVVPVLVLAAGTSWARTYARPSDGLVRLTAQMSQTLPACAAVNVSGEIETYRFLVDGQPFTQFANGAAALSHGVHLFLLSPEDAEAGYGVMTPQLASWIRSEGRLLASQASQTYGELGLWEVSADARDPLADIEQVPDGVFVHTVGSRCGGFPVTDSPAGRFATAYADLGGKAAVGPPLTAPWAEGQRHLQVLDGAVLQREGDETRALPVVADLAEDAAEAYAAAGLPPVTRADVRGSTTTRVLADRVDPRFRAHWLSVPAGSLQPPSREAAEAAVDRFGLPLGPAVEVRDGVWRQAFSRVVLSQTGDAAVTLAPLGRVAVAAGLVTPPAEARSEQEPPPLPAEELPVQSADVRPFLWSSSAVAAGLLAVWLFLRSRRGGSARLEQQSVRASTPGPEVGNDRPVDGGPPPARADEPVVGPTTPRPARTRVRLLAGLGVLLVTGGGARAVLGDGEAQVLLPDGARSVADGVFVGPRPSDEDLQELVTTASVTTLVDLAGPDFEEQAVARQLGVAYVDLTPGPDGGLPPGALPGVLDSVRAAGVDRAVYVHDDDGDGRALGQVVRALRPTAGARGADDG